METNEILDRLPRHLMSLVIDQPYNDYTPQDHEVWRYVMRQNIRFLSRKAHGSYLEGLTKTGISINEIPHMYGMNRILKEIGWAAVAVDGFIPPSAFMEFQAYNVLVIAADIRPISQIGYTPAPDIIHEAAGHAPIIADPEYAAYLKRFGEVGSKAFPSANDNRIYEAIRHLSILKADPYSDANHITKAAEELNHLMTLQEEPSELALIRNLHWWTVEYGLIGSPDAPKIYGAGLLSSIAESYYCLQSGVKKRTYSIAAAKQSFDITEPQPQLFVTPDFATLTRALEEFAGTMAFKRGGTYGVNKAMTSGSIATCMWSSGLQVSGLFSEMISHDGEPVYIRTTGATALSFNNKELDGHGTHYHAHGFGSPVGRWKNLPCNPEDSDPICLRGAKLTPGIKTKLEFESGIIVKGVVESVTYKDGRLLLISFTNCQVTYGSRMLFDPSWGVYDMAVGASILSAFPGPADKEACGFSFPVPTEKTHKIIHDENARKLHEHYGTMRAIRSGELPTNLLPELWTALQHFPDDWLCAMGILEVVRKNHLNETVLMRDIETRLKILAVSDPALAKLINDGISLIDTEATLKP